jgi:thiol:disulfide interchange protein
MDLRTRTICTAVACVALVIACQEGERAKAARSPATGPEIAEAPAEGEVAQIVRRAEAAAERDGRQLLVYVSAEWCEPCRRFSRAVRAGDLDQAFPRLRLLKFDNDRDHQRLEAAGYVSRMIPLFAAPGADGRGSGRQIAGSIKGPGAVDNIAPRLRELLGESR